MIDFNKKWAKEVGKEEFVKQLTPAYPDVDLSAEYDKIVPPDQDSPDTTDKQKKK